MIIPAYVEKNARLHPDKTAVIFEDRILPCHGCNAPLFPEALAKRLRTKFAKTEGLGVFFDLCPSCRMKTPWAEEKVEKSK